MNEMQDRHLLLPEAVIFDLDGTLFQTESLSVLAFRQTFEQLRAERIFATEAPPIEVFMANVGGVLSDLWGKLVPESSPAFRTRASQLLLENQLVHLAEGRGDLYPGVAETLKQLYEAGYKLFVASNGQEQYVKEIVAQKGLSKWFTAVYSAGEYRTASKVDLVRVLLDTYSVKTAWMCGDRYSDIEAGKENNLWTVGCAYAGYGPDGELKEADMIINSVPELAGVLMQATTKR